MKRFVQATFISFTAWLLAAFINAILMAAGIFIFEHLNKHLGVFFVATFLYSLLFSIPGIFIFWVFFITNYYKEQLFQVLLKTALCTSLGSCLLVITCFDIINFWLSIPVVIAAVAAVMAHHTTINNIIRDNQNKQTCID